MVNLEQYVSDMWLAGVRLQHAKKRIKGANEYTDMLVTSLYEKLNVKEDRLSEMIQQESYESFYTWNIYKGGSV